MQFPSPEASPACTPALDLVAQVLRPDGVQGAQAARGLDVAHHAHHDHWGGFNDGDGLAGLLLVQLGAGLVHIAQDVGAACGSVKGGQPMGIRPVPTHPAIARQQAKHS